jgi:hypothetical protein
VQVDIQYEGSTGKVIKGSERELVTVYWAVRRHCP